MTGTRADVEGAEAKMGERIEEMEVGREMDAAVAVAWLGWRWVYNRLSPGDAYLMPPEEVAKYLPERVHERPPEGWQPPGPWSAGWHRDLPRCSEEMGAAWLVVAGLNAAGWTVEITSYADGLCDVWVRHDQHPTRAKWARGLPAAEGICRASLGVPGNVAAAPRSGR